VDRATDDPAWERLAPFEVRWALLVLRLVDGALNQVAAVADARRRGGTWAAIGDALGVTAASAHTRFAAKI
jgi:type II secretory pathway component PulK